MIITVLFLNFVLLKHWVVAQEWLHCAVLDSDGKYNVCWRTGLTDKDEQEITFKVEVAARGYVGFGLSPNGGMAGSDIVTGWIHDGEVFFQDRHGKGNWLPEIDTSVDWHLITGSENDTHTSLVFRRKLDTCDKDDMKIDESTMRLIYAYSDEDPKSVDDLKYHYKNRGTKSVLLLQTRKENQQKIDKSNLLYWDVLLPNITISSEHSTIYWCKIFKAPELSSKHHIVLVEPLIQRGHEGYVHHIDMNVCVGATTHEYDPHVELTAQQCYHPNMPDAIRKCDGVFFAWAVGGEDMLLPEHVGVPLDPNPPKYYMLEIHYDNPFLHDGIVDQSGFRIYYTPELRKYDAGTLLIGANVSKRIFVPPKRKEYVIAGHSNPDCFDPVIPEDGVKVIGTVIHAHLLGRRLIARHFRNQTELRPLAVDSNYDYNYQEYRYFSGESQEVKLLKGDRVTVECTYDSSKRNETTFGGKTATDEMCMVFLLYYPLIERFASLSEPRMTLINDLLGGNLVANRDKNESTDRENELLYEQYRDYDWDKVDVKMIENSLRYSSHESLCFMGNGDTNSIRSLVSYPSEIKIYEAKSSCVKKEYLKGDDYHNGSQTQQWELYHLYIFISFSYYILWLRIKY